MAQGGSDATTTEMVEAENHFVSGNYFDLLGIAPAAGRVFNNADDRVHAEKTIARVTVEGWLDSLRPAG